MKRLLTLVLSALLLLTSFAFVGCIGGEDRTEKHEAGKVQLNVGYSTSGYGDAWFKKICKDFEKIYPNVQVIENDRTNAINNGDVGVSGITDDVVFYGFSKPQENINSIIEVTDIYDVPAYDAGYNYVGGGYYGATEEGASVASVTLRERIGETEQRLLNYNEAELIDSTKHEYYGVPFNTGLFGFWYDMDLFEQNGLYCKTIADSRTLGYAGYDGVPGNADDCWGPDHTEGTFDDGLPSTWYDFKKLCMRMKNANIAKAPFIWTGQHVWMTYQGTEAIVQSYEGWNNYSIHSTFDGEYIIDDQGNTKTITPDKGYELWTVDKNNQMPYKKGEKAAVVFSDFIASNKLYAEACVTGASHTSAQIKFLESKFNTTKIPRNAFLMEGMHWQYEARKTFSDHATLRGAENALDARKFGYLVIPRFTAKTADEVEPQLHDKNVVNIKGGGVGITMLKNANRKDSDTGVKVLDVAKEFLLFTQGNEVLKSMVSDLRVVPTTTLNATESEKELWNPMVKNALEYIDSSKKIPAGRSEPTAELCYWSGTPACKVAGKSAAYHKAVESTFSSYIYFGSCVIPNSTTATCYLFNEFCVKAYKGQAITAKTWLDGMVKWVNTANNGQGLNATTWATAIKGVK